MAYIDSIQGDKPGTRTNKISSVNMFNEFVLSEYDGVTSEEIIQDMLDNPEMKNGIFQVLHEFAKYAEKKVSHDTLIIYLCWLRKYLHARGIKVDVDDMNAYFKQNNTIKPVLKELKHPLKLSEIQSIISIADINRQRIYSVLVSSGIRIGEAMSLKKSDLSFEHDRVMITIRAENAKNGEERITFMSQEAQALCQPLFDNKTSDEMIFGNPRITSASRVTNETQLFDRLRKKLGLTDTYKSGTAKITLHSMRSYFVSKITKNNENLGHALAGHSVYMKRYERFEVDELIEAYIKSEPELTIIDLTRKDTEIKNLKNANMQNSQLRIQNKMLEDIIKKLPVSNEIKEQTARSLNDEDYLI